MTKFEVTSWAQRAAYHDSLAKTKRSSDELERDILKPARLGGTSKNGRKHIYLTAANREQLKSAYDNKIREMETLLARTFGRGQ